MDVLIGLDAGTTATKAVTAGADAVVRDVVSVGYPLLVPAPGWAELDARRLMRAAVEALTQVTAAAQERGGRWPRGRTAARPPRPLRCARTAGRRACTRAPAPQSTRCHRWSSWPGGP